MTTWKSGTWTVVRLIYTCKKLYNFLSCLFKFHWFNLVIRVRIFTVGVWFIYDHGSCNSFSIILFCYYFFVSWIAGAEMVWFGGEWWRVCAGTGKVGLIFWSSVNIVDEPSSIWKSGSLLGSLKLQCLRRMW